jgi:hypothetical protein
VLRKRGLSGLERQLV